MTDEQQSIVDMPPGARLLATAGPGTGKTHVLVGRLAHLVCNHGLSPGHEIAVLTFSRAAVREIRRRASSSAGDIRYVRAVTFDSFATRLLAEFAAEGDWTSGDYDARIRAATELIRSRDEVRERIAEFAHVFVDEVQDLVGDRAELVKAILETAGGGFTLVGDPAQGIYNFQLKGDARVEGSAALYRWLRQRFAGILKEITLTKNHRAETPGAERALWAGARLNAQRPDYAAIKYELQTVVGNLPTLGRLETACTALKKVTMSTAILCRTNGEALMISRQLYAGGIPHTLRRSATERVLPPWIGILFAGMDMRQIGRASFLKRAGELLAADFDAESAWAILLRASNSGRGPTVDVGRLAERIRTRNLPDDLLDEEGCGLVVSTIHRAKGLEFDCVILAVPSGEFGSGDPAQEAEDTRLLYVALTRPRRQLQHVELLPFRGLRENQASGRWVRTFGWRTGDFEVRGDDTHREDPAGAFLLEECDPCDTQRYLASAVKRGDPVVLTRLKAADKGQTRVFYEIAHDSRTIGITSESFGATLYRALKRNAKWEVNWPVRIEDLRIEGVDTVAGSEAAGRRCGLGASGMWLRSRISGLGALRFEKLQ